MSYLSIRFVTLIIIIRQFSLIHSQLAYSELSKIGIIKGKTYQLKIRGRSSEQLMVIKFVPDIQNLTKCINNTMEDYKNMVKRILIPINSSIAIMRSFYHQRSNDYRFIGAVLGGVALGVATSAQITAGLALHNSLQNAKSIESLKQSIANSNKAIEKLSDSTGRVIFAVNGLQNQINSQIIPNLNAMGCQVAENTLGLKLNQYFSELSLVFGPNLRDPSSETISIQTLAKAFNNDFETFLKTLHYTEQDLLDVMESDSIRARVIYVDLDNYLIGLQIEYPALFQALSSTIQEMMLISYNSEGEEWMSVFPNHILVRKSLLSNIDLSFCSKTSNSFICRYDTSSPMSTPLLECARGKTSSCARKKVITSAVPRYALSDGVIFANCMATSCLCRTNNHHLMQDSKATNVMITQEMCKEVLIDNLYISLGSTNLSRSTYAMGVQLGTPISTDPVDISSQLAEAQQDLSKAKESLKKSNDILNRINPTIVNTSTGIFLIVISVLFLVWALLSLAWLITLTRQIDNLKQIEQNYDRRRDYTVNSLSSLIPTT